MTTAADMDRLATRLRTMPPDVREALIEILEFVQDQYDDGLPDDHPVLPATETVWQWLGFHDDDTRSVWN